MKNLERNAEEKICIKKKKKLNNININNVLNSIHSVVTHIPRVWNILVWNIWSDSREKNAFKGNFDSKNQLFFVQHNFSIEPSDWQEFSVTFKIDKANQRMMCYSKICVLKPVPTEAPEREWNAWELGLVTVVQVFSWAQRTPLSTQGSNAVGRDGALALSAPGEPAPLFSFCLHFLLSCSPARFSLSVFLLVRWVWKSLVYKNSHNGTLRANYVLASLGSLKLPRK